jgi:predicted GH43/DUF377 family glycosyl hydrolase
MKKIILLILLSTFSFSIFSQYNSSGWKWVKNEEPVLVNGETGSWDDDGVGFPSVLKLNDTYHMWYGGIATGAAGLQIGHATSTDGMVWETDSQNPVLPKGEAGSWDEQRVYIPTVVHDGSVFHMWYVGAGSEGTEYAGYATSEDGTNWTKSEVQPTFMLDGKPFEKRMSVHGVIYDGEKFKMWSHTSSLYEIYHATSSDGLVWNISPETVELYRGDPGEWDYPRMQISSAAMKGDTIHLCYSGGDFYDWRIGYATSTDGINWTKDEINPVLDPGEAGGWDDLFIAFGSLMYDESVNKFKMWYYAGAEFLEGSIGYAQYLNVTGTYDKSYDQKLLVYPNPASDQVTIQTSVKEKQVLEIHSLIGQLMFCGKVDKAQVQLDLSGFRKGVYILTLKSESGSVSCKLIIN